MGRAGRKQDMLHELREEGLSEEWQDYWQGERREIKNLSTAFPGGEKIIAAGSAGEIRAMLEAASKGEDLRGDPVLEQLFQRERQAVECWAERAEAVLGRPSQLRKIDWDDLEEYWRKRFITDLHSATEKQLIIPRWSALHYYALQRIGRDRVSDHWEEIGKEWGEWAEVDPQGFAEMMRREAVQLLADVNLQPHLRSLSASRAAMVAVHGEDPFQEMLPELEGARESELDYLYLSAAQTLAQDIWREGGVEGSDMSEEDRWHSISDGLSFWLSIQLQEHKDLPLWTKLEERSDTERARKAELPRAFRLIDGAMMHDVARGSWSLEDALFRHS